MTGRGTVSGTTNYFYQLGSVLYTGGRDGQVNNFNLLNSSDAFATEGKNAGNEDYYFYIDDAKGSTVYTGQYRLQGDIISI